MRCTADERYRLHTALTIGGSEMFVSSRCILSNVCNSSLLGNAEYDAHLPHSVFSTSNGAVIASSLKPWDQKRHPLYTIKSILDMRIENLSSIDMMETIVRLGGPPKDWGVQNLFLFVMSVRVFAFNIAVQLLIETGPLISVGPYCSKWKIRMRKKRAHTQLLHGELAVKQKTAHSGTQNKRQEWSSVPETDHLVTVEIFGEVVLNSILVGSSASPFT